MYDPFAQPPAPGTVAITSTDLAANNALAPVAANGNTGVVPPNLRGNGRFDTTGFMGAMNDWRAAMPDRPTFDREAGRPDDWRAQMQAFHDAIRQWVQSHPHMRDFRNGGQAPGDPAPQPMPPVAGGPASDPGPVMTPGGGGTGGPPQGPNTRFPINPGSFGQPQMPDWRSLIPSGAGSMFGRTGS